MIYTAAMILLIYKMTQDDLITVNRIIYKNDKLETTEYSVNMSGVKRFKDIMDICDCNNSESDTCKPKYGLFVSDSHMESLSEHYFKDMDLTLVLNPNNEEVRIITKENDSWINNMKIVDYYYNILDSVKVDQTVSIKNLEMLDGEEIEQQVVGWNNTKHEFPSDKCVHQLIEDKADSNPNGIAVIWNDCTYTRKEVNEKANQLAKYILNNFSLDKKHVAICMDKSIDMVVGILAILKLGCAYLPIDISYPDERISYMIDDSEVEIVLTHTSLIKKFSNCKHIVAVDTIKDEIGLYDGSNLRLEVNPDEICYLIYTSGSTGNPKGVLANHRGRVNNFYDFNDRFNINEEDRLLAISSLSFDMCAYDVLGSLMAGSSIVLPNPKLSLQPFHWMSLIEKYNITIWHSVPTLLEMLIKCKQARVNAKISSLRLFLLGGDWIPVSLPNRIRQYTDDPQIISLGGATEASMDSIIYYINDVDENWVSIPYGKPMRNQTAYILGNDMGFLPVGAVGELFIGGVGVTDGYFNKKELTDSRFINFSWNKRVKDRIYKTGDLARYLPDGTIQLIGRSDYQVKLDGVRVELGEVEKKICNYPDVKEAIVTCITNEKGKKLLVAFIILKDPNKKLDENDLRDYLSRYLLIKCIPQNYVFLSQFPLTPNGKIARSKLIEIAKENNIEVSYGKTDS